MCLRDWRLKGYAKKWVRENPYYDIIYAVQLQIFHDGGRYHIETNPLICRANQWTGFYMITASVMKELNP